MFAANVGQYDSPGMYWGVGNLPYETQWLSSIVPNSTTIFVAGRGGGVAGTHGLAYSTDSGKTWTSSTALKTLYNNTGALQFIAYGEGAPSPYLCVSLGPKVATSPDGITGWVDRPQITTIGLAVIPRAAVWDVNQWLLVGDSGGVATSPDGITWTNQTGLSSTAWGTSVVYGIVTNFAGFRYLVYGQSGKIATSPDGVNWTYRGGLASTAWGTNSAFVGMSNESVGSPLLVLAGSTGAAATSTDGVNWTYQPGLAASGMSGASAGVYTGNGFIVGTTNGPTAYSVDGVTWRYSASLIPAWTWSGFPTVALSSMARQGIRIFAFGNTQLGRYGVTS